MTPIEPASPPRKASWKRWVVVAACAAAVATIAFVAIPPKPEPVRVWFVGYTNQFGRKCLVFEGTNGTPAQIEVNARVVTGEIRQVRATIPNAETLDRTLTNRFEARTSTPRGECFRFIVPVPRKDVPYCVIWHVPEFLRPTWRYGKLRGGCYDFLMAHNMPRLAGYVAPYGKLHYIPSTEIKE